MPMRNAAPFVRSAALSVLEETAVLLELLIVDDGSTDGSAAIVTALDDPRVRLLVGPQRGIAACMNTGLAHARGEVIMRCDADDLYPSGRMRQQVAALRAAPEAVAVCGGFEMIDDSGLTVSQPFSDSDAAEIIDIRSELLAGILRTSLCTFAIRQTAVAEVAGFREYFQTAEDVDFALRLGGVGPVIFSAACCYKYRIHGASITHSISNNRRVFFDEMALQFACQRLKSGSDDLMQGVAPVPPDLICVPLQADDHVLSLVTASVWSLHLQKKYQRAISIACGGVKKYPLNVNAWILLSKILIKSFYCSAGGVFRK